MLKKKFKLSLRFKNELNPGKLFIETRNECILEAGSSREAMLKAIILIKKIVRELAENVKSIDLKEITLYELKEVLSTNVETEGTFHWSSSNEGLPAYDSEEIMLLFDKYRKNQTNQIGTKKKGISS